MERASNPKVPTYIPSVLEGDDDRQMNKIVKNLKWARLSLGGAIIGYAVAHMLEAHFAPGAGLTIQSVGAVSGTAVAAVLAKAVHIV